MWYIDRFIKRIFASEKKIIPFKSLPVSILMVHEAESERTEEQYDDIVTNIMAEQYFNQEVVQVVRTVIFKPLSQTFVLVATDANGVVQIDALTQFERNYPRIVIHSLMNVFPQGFIYLIVDNSSTSVITLAKHQRVAIASSDLSEIIHIKNDEYSSYPPPSNAVDSVNVFH